MYHLNCLLQHEAYAAHDQGQDYSQYHQVYQGQSQDQQEETEKQYAAYAAAQALSRYHLVAPEQEQEQNQAYTGYYDYKQLANAGLGQYQTVEEPSQDEKS